LASFGERLLAMFLDAALYFFGALIFMNAFSSIFRLLIGDSEWIWMLFVLAPVVSIIFYLGLQEMLNKGRTLGKIAVKIKVIHTDGSDLKWSAILLRALCILPDLLFSFGMAGSILINVTPRRQRIGDMAAGTVVVKVNPIANQITLEDLLSLKTLSDYQPVYPQVKSMTEKDMIFIKSVIVRSERNLNVHQNDALIQVTEHLREVLGISTAPADRVEFLRTLLRDYVVLTR
jgi:uncharacterized RDD family membrane protein YckC